MRTSGTFQDVYNAAKSYSNSDADDMPINPVVRREGNNWMLESSLEPTDCDFEIPLNEFHDWFFEAYQQDDYIPDDDDVSGFIKSR